MWVHIRDNSVMRSFCRPEIDARWATKSNYTEMMLICETFFDYVFLHERLIRERIKMEILIVN